MELTGKALNAFKSWYEVKYGKHYSWDIFKDIPKSIQWGVYQDWADSIGVRIEVKPDYDDYLGYNRGFIPYVNVIPAWRSNDCFETRQEARDAAIEKLNELINNG